MNNPLLALPPLLSSLPKLASKAFVSQDVHELKLENTWDTRLNFSAIFVNKLRVKLTITLRSPSRESIDILL